MNDGLLRTLDPAPAFTPEDAATSEALLTTILAEQVPSGRRPARLVLAAAAAVLAVAGVVWGANLGRPALVAAPTPAPTGRTTPTPTATPSGPVTASAAPSSAWPTPTLSCSDFRAAWRAAFASRIDFPPSAGRDPVLVGVDGERVLVEGTVAGERLVQDFPDGLAGVPRRGSC